MFISKGNGKCIIFFCIEHIFLSFAPSGHREFYWISLLTRLYLRLPFNLSQTIICSPATLFIFSFQSVFFPLIPTPTLLLSYVLPFLLHTHLFTPSPLSLIYLLPFPHRTLLFPPPPLLLSYLLLFFLLILPHLSPSYLLPSLFLHLYILTSNHSSFIPLLITPLHFAFFPFHLHTLHFPPLSLS